PAQVPVHVPAGVDAAHELLTDEAALRERHRVTLEERLLGDRGLVDVDAEARDPSLDAKGVEAGSVPSRHRRGERGDRVVDERRGAEEIDARLGAPPGG